MPKRPDLRNIAKGISESLDDLDKDTLQRVLTFVFKEYLVEGPPPLLVNQTERLEDLENLSFAELIGALQTRLDLEELSLFQVAGDQVSVRIDGLLQPLSLSPSLSGGGGATAMKGAETYVASSAPVDTASQGASNKGSAKSVGPRGVVPLPANAAPGVHVIETVLPPRNAPNTDNAARSQQTPPAGARMSLRANPRRTMPATAQTPPAAAPPSPKKDPEAKTPETPEDDAATRFSLLELD